MQIGVVVDPHSWVHWDEAKTYLEPAAKQGGFIEVLEPDEELFAVLDGDTLLAVATAWFSADERMVEVKLVGGREHRRWIKELDGFVGACAAAAGATQLRAWGRAGWIKSLGAAGWDHSKLEDGSMGYVRRLGDSLG
jgi:hypothetical protein